MHRVAALCFCLASLVAASSERPVRAEEPESFTTPADLDGIELCKLAVEYDRLNNLRDQTNNAAADALNDGGKPSDEKLSDEEWLKAGQEIESKVVDPDEQMLPKFLEFAKSRPSSPDAFDALFFVICRGGPATGNVRGKPWQLKEEALDLVWKDHLNDPRLFAVLELLGGALPSLKTEAFLTRVLDEGPDNSAKAAAAYNLARYHATIASAHHRSQRIKQKEHLLNVDRFWKIVVTPYLETEFPLDEERNSAETERFLRLVTDKYSDVPAVDWELTGPGKILVKAIPYSKPKSYGDLSRALSFELNNIQPSRPAPEIEGTDADGKQFRLSDYKGKVVLLVFSANWCGGCVAMHPVERKLVEKYHDQPFVLLGVSRDVKVDTLQADTKSGEITWRCWWDGMYGPIRETWNAESAPRIILLDDQHRFDSVTFDRLTTQEEFEKAIDRLLKNIRAS